MKRIFTSSIFWWFVAWVAYMIVVWPYIYHCFILQQGFGLALFYASAPTLVLLVSRRLWRGFQWGCEKALFILCAVSTAARKEVARIMEAKYKTLNQNA